MHSSSAFTAFVANTFFIFVLLLGMAMPANSNEQSFPSSLGLANIFSDHMVVQRNKPIVIWGTAIANSQVYVTMASHNGATETLATAANDQGAWQITLNARPAGGPYQLKVQAQGANNLHDIILVNDILVGDVWLASGQSNMEWQLGGDTTNWQQEVAASDLPAIRFFKLDKRYSASPQTDIPGRQWHVAGPKTSAQFSAVAWHFAKRYHLQTGIPVAIIDSTWGGTPAEAWTSTEALLSIEGYQTAAKDMQDNAVKWQQKFVENSQLEQQKWQLIGSEQAYQDGKILRADFDDGHWPLVILPNAANHALSDIVWARKHLYLDALPVTASLDIGELNQIGQVFVNGTRVYNESWQDSTQLVSFDAGLLRKGDNIIVIRALNSWDNKVLIGQEKRFFVQTDEKRHDLSGLWRVSNQVEAPIPKVSMYNWQPGVLFNGMINPLTAFPIQGVIWYQGENNVGAAALYADLFKGLISDWRKQWQTPNLPFLFVQLASYMQPKSQPTQSAWAELREAQASALTLPNTAMVVALDVGDAEDIHPRDKASVGQRLWLAAQHLVLQQNTPYSGPVLDSYSTELTSKGAQMRLSFSHVYQGLKVKGESLLGFAMAGQDGKFFNAEASIIGNEVVVSSASVAQPKALRYGWADNSPANLYNSADLPAAPFRIEMPVE
ncbi:MAG: sialate O-acetylesterase [Paraglaciecola sp.]|nr:sialate O-acetylesterase [Paraglaciecola sp.]